MLTFEEVCDKLDYKIPILDRVKEKLIEAMLKLLKMKESVRPISSLLFLQIPEHRSEHFVEMIF